MAGCKAAFIVGSIVLLCLYKTTPSVAQGDQVIHVAYTIKEEISDTFIGSVISDARLDQLFPNDLSHLEFAFLPQSDTYIKHFVLGETTGQLWTNGSLDRDNPSLCPQQWTCHFGLDIGIMKPLENFRIIKVNITLEDINDNAPIFTPEKFSLSISEAVIPVVSFVIPAATDKDVGQFGIQRYELKPNSSKFQLQVTNEDGTLDPKLLLKTKLDRELTNVYNMQLVAYDGGPETKSSTMDIEVTVRDANDNNPVFGQSSYSAAVPEDFSLQKTLIQVNASDPDLGPNGDIIYKFASQTQDVFGINNETGEIFLKKALDYETQTQYQLQVIAEDQGPDSLPAHTKVTIHIEDVNDHPPQMTIRAVSGGSLIVPENRRPGVAVAHVSVEDQDEGKSGQVSCELDSEFFSLESVYRNTLYRIVSLAEFDREQTSEYIVFLWCQDEGQPSLRKREEIRIEIGDENDNPPSFSQLTYYGRIKENGSVSLACLTVNATDLDSGLNGQVRYELHPDAQGLVRVEPTTGVIVTNVIFDRERMEEFVFHVLAIDKADDSLSAMATVTLTIEDINDEAPVFSKMTYNFGTFENQGEEVEIGSVSATDADLSPYNSFVFSLGHQGNVQDTFEIDENSGRIATRTALDREYRDTYHLVVIATNTEFPHLSSSVSVTVQVADTNDNAPMIGFPNPLNNSLQVSSDTPRGYIFSHIQATDADVAENGRLIYLIAKGDEEDVFDIDPLNGGMSANVDLANVNEMYYELLIMVKDQGNPQKAAVASLYLTVNTTLAFVWFDSGDEDTEVDGVNPSVGEGTGKDSGGLGFHQKIIIILACVTAVLVTILVAAIFWVRHKQRQRMKETYKYMCRVDLAQRMPVGQSTVTDLADNTDSDSSKECCEIRLNRNGPDSSINTYPLIQHQKTHLTLEDLQRAQWNRQHSLQNMVQQRSAPAASSNHLQSPRGATTAAPPHHSNKNKMEVQQLLQLLKRDTDAESTSGSSAEMSNTDSGRGPSEEGGEGHGGRTAKSALLNRTPDGQEKDENSLERGRAVPPPRPPRAASLKQQPRTSAAITNKPPITPSQGVWNKNKPTSSHHNTSQGTPQGHQCHNPEGLCQCPDHFGSQSTSPNQILHPAYYHHRPSSASSRLHSPGGSNSGSAKGLRTTQPHLSTFGHPQAAEDVSNTASDNDDMSDDDGSSTSGSFIVELDNVDLRAVDV